MIFNHIYILPIVTFTWFPLTFVVMYIAAVLLDDVNPLFPYISDTGTFSPGSCFFGQMINTGSILLGIVIYIRYKQVDVVLVRINSSKFLKRLNAICLWLGLVASFGISVVGNFQETNMFWIHMVGAGTGFGLGSIYMMIQTFVSFKFYPALGHKTTNYVRAVISVICVTFLTSTCVFGLVSFLLFTGNIVDIPKWSEEQGGYEHHLVSTVSEWITAIFTMAYILSYTGDFKKIVLHEPVVEVSSVKENNTNANDRFNVI